MFDSTEFRERADEAIRQGRRAFEQAQAHFHSQFPGGGAQLQHQLNDAAHRAGELFGAATERTEQWLAVAREDPRFGRAVTTAEAVTAAVVETVQEHVVKPAVELGQRFGLTVPGSGGESAHAAGDEHTDPPADDEPARGSGRDVS